MQRHPHRSVKRQIRRIPPKQRKMHEASPVVQAEGPDVPAPPREGQLA